MQNSRIHFTWLQKSLALIIIALIANHLIELENFPLSESYSFPLFSIITSIIIGVLILIITELNFKNFKKKHFLKKITSKEILFFLLSTLVIISIAYIPIYYFVIWLQNGENSIFDLIGGLSVTLLISCLMIIVAYSKPIYALVKQDILNDILIIKKESKKTVINYNEIAYIISENKTVYVITLEGKAIATDYSLNYIENKISCNLFFRANRQTLVHPRCIKEIKIIENGKLSITLEPSIFGKPKVQIGVSRYKKKDFNNWFEGKLKHQSTIQL